MPSEPQQPTSIGGHLKSVKQESFVGRQKELQQFEDTLLGRCAEWKILNVYGPGGIGKSSLLDAFRRCAEQHNTFYLYLDAKDLQGSPQVVIDKLNQALALADTTPGDDLDMAMASLYHIADSRPIALVIDSYEAVGELNRWLREAFLARLPNGSALVIAGRYALNELWQDHDSWCKIIEPMPLTDFDQQQSSEYLKLQGIDNPRTIEQAWRYSQGHPLALNLIALVVNREGDTAIDDIPDRPDVINKLVHRWLREIDDEALRTLVEAAAVVRTFDQDLLSSISEQQINALVFEDLISCSFVRHHHNGWALHDLVRDALVRSQRARSANTLHERQIKALHHFARRATERASSTQRSRMLHEFFYLLGDELVNALLYNDSLETGLYLETATDKDLNDLKKYMQDWRDKRGVIAGIKLELYNRDQQTEMAQWVESEPREPEFLKMKEILQHMPGTIRTLRDPQHQLRGMTIVYPINQQTLPYLQQQPVSSDFANHLATQDNNGIGNNLAHTQDWFIRLIDTRDSSDLEARRVLSRDLVNLFIRPARFITTTPLAFYQEMLTRFGFTRIEDIEPHYDFGADRPSPYFELDLRGPRLNMYLQNMIKSYAGDASAGGLDESLVDALANEVTQSSQQQEHLIEHQQKLLDLLSKREREVAVAAAEGLPNCSIAARLNVSEVTIKKHMSNIFQKLSVRNRSALIKQYWNAH